MGTMAPEAWSHPQGGVAPKPWIGALAAGDSIILNICEGEEGEREKGADQGRLIL
jgi:hypothetical protein